MATYGCEYCNERVEYEVRDGMRYCMQCGSALGPTGAAGLMFAGA